MSNLVEALAGCAVAVVAQLDSDQATQPFSPDLAPDVFELVAARRNTVRGHAEMARFQANKCSPTTADIEQRLARLAPELAAQVIERVALRLLQALFGVFEVGAGRHYLLVQPERGELVRDVILAGNGMPVSLVRISMDKACAPPSRLDGRVTLTVSDNRPRKAWRLDSEDSCFGGRRAQRLEGML